MRFKTTIEIISEAEDKNEAMDIAGEYLSGNVVSGVEMKCFTKAVTTFTKGAFCIAAISLLFITGIIFSTLHIKDSQTLRSPVAGIGAIQPPLKTLNADKKNSEFKNEWEEKQRTESLSYIKKLK